MIPKPPAFAAVLAVVALMGSGLVAAHGPLPGAPEIPDLVPGTSPSDPHPPHDNGTQLPPCGNCTRPPGCQGENCTQPPPCANCTGPEPCGNCTNPPCHDKTCTRPPPCENCTRPPECQAENCTQPPPCQGENCTRPPPCANCTRPPPCGNCTEPEPCGNCTSEPPGACLLCLPLGSPNVLPDAPRAVTPRPPGGIGVEARVQIGSDGQP